MTKQGMPSSCPAKYMFLLAPGCEDVHTTFIPLSPETTSKHSWMTTTLIKETRLGRHCPKQSTTHNLQLWFSRKAMLIHSGAWMSWWKYCSAEKLREWLMSTKSFNSNGWAQRVSCCKLPVFNFYGYFFFYLCLYYSLPHAFCDTATWQLQIFWISIYSVSSTA